MQESTNLDILNVALEDEQFAVALSEASSVSVFADLLAEKGVDLSEEEVAACYEAVQKGASGMDELDAESLDDVSGGLATFPMLGWKIGLWIARKIAKR